jgi:signal transduction histidine kinase
MRSDQRFDPGFQSCPVTLSITSTTDNRYIDINKTFHSANVPTELPHDISLCLYRVLQEALQNAIKYSGSREFEVSLIRESNEIHLRVRACGVGFDTIVASKTGFDLLSVKQRLKLVDGEFSIESQPQRGTTINARVPMKERGKSKAVA